VAYMERNKQYYITSWKAQLDAEPTKVGAMTEGAWYVSWLGLLSRLYCNNCITYAEYETEIY